LPLQLSITVITDYYYYIIDYDIIITIAIGHYVIIIDYHITYAIIDAIAITLLRHYLPCHYAGCHYAGH
jgi:hypothetical protein